jgi:hypothetical protein
MNAGDFRHVPQDARHAWKNQSDEPAITIIVNNSKTRQIFSGNRKTCYCRHVPATSLPSRYSTFC